MPKFVLVFFTITLTFSASGYNTICVCLPGMTLRGNYAATTFDVLTSAWRAKQVRRALKWDIDVTMAWR